MKQKDLSCHKPEEHHLHLCVLNTTLNKKQLAEYTKNPKYICTNCNGRVNRGKNLCKPKRIRT